jgi:hypothetical protein
MRKITEKYGMYFQLLTNSSQHYWTLQRQWWSNKFRNSYRLICTHWAQSSGYGWHRVSTTHDCCSLALYTRRVVWRRKIGPRCE